MKSDSHLLIRIAVALFIVLCIVTIIELQLRLNRLYGRIEDLENQKYDIEEEIAEMKYRLSLPYDDDYAARVARIHLGYHYPDEYIFINDLYEQE